MANRLSHTSISKYNTCAKQYYYHYVEKYRPKVQGSALAFGSSIDGGLNTLLSGKTLEEAYKAFDDLWSEQEINKQRVQLKHSTLLAYAESDFDEDLLTESAIFDLLTNPIVGDNDPVELVKELRKRKKITSVTDEELSYINQALWHILRHKGHIFIKTYNSKYF